MGLFVTDDVNCPVEEFYFVETTAATAEYPLSKPIGYYSNLCVPPGDVNKNDCKIIQIPT